VPRESRPDFTGTRQLAVAPFCNDKGLALTMPSRGGRLISCQDDLNRLPDEALDGTTTFVINELAGIPSDESSQEQGILTGLHAKLYVIEAGRTARVLLGSANAIGTALLCWLEANGYQAPRCSLVSRFRSCFTLCFGQDLVGGFGPHERFTAVVP
jgi:hypothetical protein